MSEAVIPFEDRLGIRYNFLLIYPEGIFIASPFEVQDSHPEASVFVPNHPDPFLRPIVEGTKNFNVPCVGSVQEEHNAMKRLGRESAAFLRGDSVVGNWPQQNDGQNQDREAGDSGG